MFNDVSKDSSMFNDMAASVTSTGNLDTIKKNFNKHRGAIKAGQKVIGVYGRITGDPRAIVVDKLIDVGDHVLLDKNQQKEFQKGTKSKEIPMNLKVNKGKFIGYGDGYGLEETKVSLNAGNEKDAVSKAVNFLKEKFTADGRVSQDNPMSAFKVNCVADKNEPGRFNVIVLMDNVKERLEKFEMLNSKPLVMGSLMDKSKLTEKGVLEQKQIRKDAISKAPGIVIPGMSADMAYISKMKSEMSLGKDYNSAEESAVKFMIKRFGAERTVSALERNSLNFVGKSALGKVKSLDTKKVLQAERNLLQKVISKAKSRGKDFSEGRF